MWRDAASLYAVGVREPCEGPFEVGKARVPSARGAERSVKSRRMRDGA